MKTLRKKIQARATAAKANLDAAILGLRQGRLEQLMKKLEKTKKHLDGDLAWNIASGVLAKVKAVRESMKPETKDVISVERNSKRGQLVVKSKKITPKKVVAKKATAVKKPAPKAKKSALAKRTSLKTKSLKSKTKKRPKAKAAGPKRKSR